MDQKQSDFVYARSVFKDKTKAGGDKVTLFLGIDDLIALKEKIEKEGTGEGIKLQVFITERDGKQRGSILVSDPAKKGQRPAGNGGSSFGQGSGPKKFAYKPKSPVKALG